MFSGENDYELAFTVPVAARSAVKAASNDANTPVTRIGQIGPGPGLRLVDAEGHAVHHTFSSFDHFA